MVKLNTREVCFPLPTQSTLPCAPQMPSDPQLDSAKGARASGGVRRGREGFRVLPPRFLLQLVASPPPPWHLTLPSSSQPRQCSHAVQAPEPHPFSSLPVHSISSLPFLESPQLIGGPSASRTPGPSASQASLVTFLLMLVMS